MDMQHIGRPQKTHGLRFGALGEETLHLCVDMQNLFATGSEWATPWMERVLPNVVTLIEHKPEDLAFTRFIPLARQLAGRYFRLLTRLDVQDFTSGLRAYDRRAVRGSSRG